MVDVHNKRCEAAGCDKHPTYGMANGRARFCTKHKDPEMVRDLRDMNVIPWNNFRRVVPCKTAIDFTVAIRYRLLSGGKRLASQGNRTQRRIFLKSGHSAREGKTHSYDTLA